MATNLAQKHLNALIKSIEARVEQGAPFGWRDPDNGEWYSEKTDAPDDVELEPASAYDYLSDAYEIVDFVQDDNYRGARVCIALGGPNAYIELWGSSGEVKVAWWSETVRADLPREFTEPLFDALEDLHSMR